MSQKTKLYKLLKKGKRVVSLIPGTYAGNTTHQIFGRLDCKSGMRMHKESRVFFANWEDAIAAGYRPCEKCGPRHSDFYPEQIPVKMALLAEPHISLWKSGPPPNRNRPERAYYVALNWEEKKSGKTMSNQISLSDHFVYQQARAIAVALGKKCNLPVLRHGPIDFDVIGIPMERTNDIDIARDKQELEKLQKSKKITGFSSAF